MGTSAELMPDRDDDTGQYREDHPDEAFLAALREADGMSSTTAVAEAVGCTHSTAFRRLSELAEDGAVVKIQPSRSVFWRIVED